MDGIVGGSLTLVIVMETGSCDEGLSVYERLRKREGESSAEWSK